MVYVLDRRWLRVAHEDEVPLAVHLFLRLTEMKPQRLRSIARQKQLSYSPLTRRTTTPNSMFKGHQFNVIEGCCRCDGSGGIYHTTLSTNIGGETSLERRRFEGIVKRRQARPRILWKPIEREKGGASVPNMFGCYNSTFF